MIISTKMLKKLVIIWLKLIWIRCERVDRHREGNSPPSHLMSIAAETPILHSCQAVWETYQKGRGRGTGDKSIQNRKKCDICVDIWHQKRDPKNGHKYTVVPYVTLGSVRSMVWDLMNAWMAVRLGAQLALVWGHWGVRQMGRQLIRIIQSELPVLSV